MKFAFKRWVAVAAFAATSAASAASATSGYDWSLTSGNVNWTLNNDGPAVLRASSGILRLPAKIPAISGLHSSDSSNSAAYIGIQRAAIGLLLNGVTSQGDSLSSLQMDNSLVDFKWSWYDGELDEFIQKSIFTTDWSIDLKNATIYANVYTRTYDGSAISNLGKIAFFKAGPPDMTASLENHIVLDTIDAQGQATGHAQGELKGELRLTPEALQLIRAGYAVRTGDEEYFLPYFRDAEWGTVSFSASFSGSPVPEPSMLGLAASGLLVLCLMKRKQACLTAF